MLQFLDRDGGFLSFEMTPRAVIQKDGRLGLGTDDEIDARYFRNLAAGRLTEERYRHKAAESLLFDVLYASKVHRAFLLSTRAPSVIVILSGSTPGGSSR